MASSKRRPGPHDRVTTDADGNVVRAPKDQCIATNRFGKRCGRGVTAGSKLCAVHLRMIDNAGVNPAQFDDSDRERSKITRRMKIIAEEKERERLSIVGRNTQDSKNIGTPPSATGFVLNQNARLALNRLGLRDEANSVDPKRALLDQVTSAHRQAEIWTAMLEAIPEDDWQYVGQPPLPGDNRSFKGARIEVIQKNLSEATQRAARVSKLAIDAGIEERMVRIAEQQSALIADTVRVALIAAIDSLNLSPAARERAMQAALGAGASHLKQLAAGAAQDQGQGGVAEVLEGKFTEVR